MNTEAPLLLSMNSKEAQDYKRKSSQLEKDLHKQPDPKGAFDSEFRTHGK